MDILRDLRRRSLQLDVGDVERFRTPSERRGSVAADSGLADKKGHSGGLLHRSLTHTFPFERGSFQLFHCFLVYFECRRLVPFSFCFLPRPPCAIRSFIQIAYLTRFMPSMAKRGRSWAIKSAAARWRKSRARNPRHKKSAILYLALKRSRTDWVAAERSPSRNAIESFLTSSEPFRDNASGRECDVRADPKTRIAVRAVGGTH